MPPTAAVTFTVMVQLPGAPPGMVPPVNENARPPAGAASTPPQVVLAFGVAAITNPAGKVSVSGAVRVAGVALGLIRVMVLVEMPPALMMTGLKLTPIVGAQAVAVMTLLFNVTAPVSAKALPDKVVLVFRVILAFARILPMNEVFVPSVAELPICQNTLQGCPPLMI